MPTFRFVIFLALLLTFSRCNEHPLDIVVEPLQEELEYQRLDIDLFEADFDSIESTHQELYQKYGKFYELYLEDILKTGPSDRIESLIIAEDFVTDVYMRESYAAIREVHDPLIPGYIGDLKGAFAHYLHYFPEDSIPELIFYHSGFNFGIYSTDESIGIGLDWFLGRDHPITQKLPFPKYRQLKMDPKYLTVNVLKDWSNRKLYRDIEGENLLENLIYYGKIMYLVDAMLPSTADSIKMNWSDAEMNWCRENEFKIWKELAADQATLFNDEAFEVKKWITDGPFTSGLPQESPGMVGVWMGWQMVKDHHLRLPESSLQEILDTDANSILRSYNPKK